MRALCGETQGAHEDKDTLYLVMELCSGGDLFASIARMVRLAEIHTCCAAILSEEHPRATSVLILLTDDDCCCAGPLH